MDVPFPAEVFFSVIPFWSYWSQKFTEAAEMESQIVLGEKQTLMEKVHYETIHADNDSRIDANFYGNR